MPSSCIAYEMRWFGSGDVPVGIDTILSEIGLKKNPDSPGRTKPMTGYSVSKLKCGNSSTNR